MRLQDLKKARLPQEPGVYLFIGPRREILYIGKATSLRDRVRSYFDRDIAATRGTHIRTMVELATSVRFEQTDSVLEALLLEAHLIRKHQPRFNTREKDDKSFNYVVITKEDFPRVLLMRGKELFNPRNKPDYEIQYSFGPFPHGTALKEALRIIRKIFPYRDKCKPGEGKPCFNRQIGLCPGVCSGEISKKEYARTIRNVRYLFEGKKKEVLRTLTKEMKQAAKDREFEHADRIKRTIFALEHIHDVALMKNDSLRAPDRFRIESYDIAHISGKFAGGVMTVVEGGEAQKSDYRKFTIKSFEGVNDTRALAEVLERRLGHAEWPLPRIFVMDGGKAQKNIAEKILKEAGIAVPVLSVVKDERHRPREILGKRDLAQKYEKDILLANTEAHRFAISWHRQKRGKMPK